MITISNSFLSIWQAAAQFGVSVVTIRRWCNLGKMHEAFRTIDNHEVLTTLYLVNVVFNEHLPKYSGITNVKNQRDLLKHIF
jgi:hypothetical protein